MRLVRGWGTTPAVNIDFAFHLVDLIEVLLVEKEAMVEFDGLLHLEFLLDVLLDQSVLGLGLAVPLLQRLDQMAKLVVLVVVLLLEQLLTVTVHFRIELTVAELEPVLLSFRFPILIVTRLFLRRAGSLFAQVHSSHAETLFLLLHEAKLTFRQRSFAIDGVLRLDNHREVSLVDFAAALSGINVNFVQQCLGARAEVQMSGCLLEFESVAINVSVSLSRVRHCRLPPDLILYVHDLSKGAQGLENAAPSVYRHAPLPLIFRVLRG